VRCSKAGQLQWSIKEVITGLFKKICNWLSTAAVVIAVLLAVLLAGARLLGLQVYTVLSGSMEPNYHVGSIIYVQDVDPADLKVGDVISFMLSENTVATHRIIEVLPDENDPNVIRFRTKGDNNDIPDTNPVHCNNVLGKVVGTIPLLGYVSDYIQHPPGTYVVLAIAAILVLVVFLPDIFTGARALKTDAEPQQEQPQSVIDNEQLKAELEALKQKIQQQNQPTEQMKEGNENEENV
jgi:signal peptidase